MNHHPQPDTADERGRRILVIDDNRAIHEDFRKILAAVQTAPTKLNEAESALFADAVPTVPRPCFRLDSAFQGQDGLALVQQSLQTQQPYSVAFVDVRMPPGWDGVETTQQLWAVDPDLQVVICTAYSDYSWDELIHRVGNSDRLLILKKPFDTVEVLQLANALSEKWWLRQRVRGQVNELERLVIGRTRELKVANDQLKLEVAERKQAEHVLRVKTEQLQAITQAMAVFLRDGDWQATSAILLRNALVQTNSPLGFVGAVVDGPALRILAHEGFVRDKDADPASQAALKLFADQGYFEIRNLQNLLGAVITSGTTIVANDPATDMRAGHNLPPGHPPVRHFLGAAILSGADVVGMIGIADRPGGYTGHEQSQIDILTRAAGVLYDSYRRQQREAALEQQLRQAQKVEAVGQLAGGVAHDFNNILTAILGYGELMLARTVPGDALRTTAEEVLKAAERAAALTRQLLAFSRRQILEPKVVNLNDLVNDLVKMLRRMVNENVELITASTAGFAHVEVDPTQLEQVIMNLAVNARDAMPQGGQLTIATANVVLDTAYAVAHEGVSPGDYVMLTVSDTGIGMTPEVQARLFEPFFTTKEVGKGTGLGLATCYGIVKQSGGHIAVETAPDRGTTFKIYLPRVEPVAATAAPPKPDEPKTLPTGQETILLVEDEPALRGLGAMVLRSLGYTVLEAGNGIEALKVAAAGNGGGIDLVVTDVVMPQLGGKELADRLHAGHPEIKVLFSSGYTDDTIVHQGVLDGGISFLAKPYTPDALARKVREVLDAVAVVQARV